MRRLSILRTVFPLVFLVAAVGGCGDSESPRDVVTPEVSCAIDLDCDDGLVCTIDRCMGLDETPYCSWEIAPSACLVNGVCAQAGQRREGAPCEVCDPAVNNNWALVNDESACDDGDACTTGEVCRVGRCEGTAITCDDGNGCTRDECDVVTGCTTAVLSGFTCSDADRCTLDDRCDTAARCVGRADRCDDANPCTTDMCDAIIGCTHVAQDGTTCALSNACTEAVCQNGECVAVGDTTCHDGNPCTIDTCDEAVGCVNLPTLSPCCIGASSVCDDNNPCTDDACDPSTGACTHTDSTASCDDNNVCTSGDVCRGGACVAGDGLACDDGNPCTDDACNPALTPPCVHSPRTGACDDGIECTTAETCINGRCRGDTSQCVCEPDLSADGVKLTTVQLGLDGVVGEGLDVDQNATTCAPSSTCAGGIDNGLSLLAGFANPALNDAVTGGDVMLVAEVSAVGTNPVMVAIYQAKLAAPGCDFQNTTCDYLVDPSFLDPATCEPVAELVGTVTGNRLVAGGPGTRLPFSIPFDGASLEVVIANLRLEVDLSVVDGQVSGMTGVLGGAVPKQTLIEALRQVPEGSLPAPKEAIISLVETLVINDIDTDADGVKDAASIGVRVIGRDARLVGVAD